MALMLAFAPVKRSGTIVLHRSDISAVGAVVPGGDHVEGELALDWR